MSGCLFSFFLLKLTRPEETDWKVMTGRVSKGGQASRFRPAGASFTVHAGCATQGKRDGWSKRPQPGSWETPSRQEAPFVKACPLMGELDRSTSNHGEDQRHAGDPSRTRPQKERKPSKTSWKKQCLNWT